jgi:hypothetical protein
MVCTSQHNASHASILLKNLGVEVRSVRVGSRRMQDAKVEVVARVGVHRASMTVRLQDAKVEVVARVGVCRASMTVRLQDTKVEVVARVGVRRASVTVRLGGGGKGAQHPKTLKRLETRGRGKMGIRVHPDARLSVVLKEGKTRKQLLEEERARKLKRIVSAGVVREGSDRKTWRWRWRHPRLRPR